jgi:hypothetical protein
MVQWDIIYQYLSIIILYILLYIPNVQLSFVVILFRIYILSALIINIRNLQVLHIDTTPYLQDLHNSTNIN